MISDDLKCIFLHPPRTGGKSIEKMLFGVKVRPGSADHSTYADLVEHCGYRRLNRYFKFGFRRNTWDRLLSFYFFQKDVNKQPVGTFSDFLHSRWAVRKIRSQLEWFTHNGRVSVDFIARFERYETDWKKICKRLGVEYVPSLHTNRSQHKHYSKYYTKGLKKLVAKRYADEIEFFGFKFGE